jgi:FkbM family methyltransferase
MNLDRFMPSRLKVHIIAMQINAISRIFLGGEKRIIDLFSRGGREILSGTALFPDEGFYVVDAGAFRGWYTTISSKIVGSNGFVLSFEPEPHNFEILHKVILLGKLKNVKAFKLALSDNNGFEFLYLSESPSMHSLVLKRSNKRYTVPCMRLDTIATLIKIPKLDLIKIDVEGAELKVLKGCKIVINEFQPIFSIDVNHYDGEFEEISSFMKEFNYEIRPLFCEAGKPYSIVTYPPHKRSLAEHLINKTRKLSIKGWFRTKFSKQQKKHYTL